MKNLFILLILCGLSLMIACEKETPVQKPILPTGMMFQQTYITEYTDCDRFSIVGGGATIRLHIERVTCSKTENSERFWELARRYNDTEYNRYTLPRGALGLAPTQLDVTCTSDLMQSIGQALRSRRISSSVRSPSIRASKVNILNVIPTL